MKTDKIRIQFFVTKQQYERISKHAERAGLSIDQFCRSNTFSRMEHYPLKSELYVNGDSKPFLSGKQESIDIS